MAKSCCYLKRRHNYIFLDELKERGSDYQTTDENSLRKACEEGQVSIILIRSNSKKACN